MSTSFTLIPAIDVRNARVVRLSQGDYARQTDYANSPLDTARSYAEAGAQWLHLVDLDAAKNGGYSLQSLVAELGQRTTLQIQTGGGIRTQFDLESLLSLGVSRVIIGTIAVRNPELVCEWIRTYGPHRITLALDARKDEAGNWHLPVAGWTEASAETLDGLLDRYSEAGVRHVLCTDISRDGMLGGYNLGLYRELATRWPALQIQASGGVRSVPDIVAARAAGASAAILGRALLEGQFSLPDALAC